MNRPQQQHYVTRAYLEGFVADKKKHLHVYRRGKTNGFAALPENVAKIRNYYSTKKEDGTYDDRVEHYLETHIESPGLAVIKRLDAGHYNISRDARIRLSTLLAAQEYRVPWMREQMEAFTKGMLERAGRAMAEAPGVIEEKLSELSLAEEGDIEKVAKKLRRALLDGNIEVVATPGASLRAMGHMLEILPNFYFTMG